MNAFDGNTLKRAILRGQELLSWFGLPGGWGTLHDRATRESAGYVRGHLGTLLRAARFATFQHRADEWEAKAFEAMPPFDVTERGDRVLEEVLELLQAHGYDPARVAPLVDYVFSRPIGAPYQEVGGVMVTLALFCSVAKIDLHAAGESELARISGQAVMAKIRAKQAAKNALHSDSPLPGSASANQRIGEARVPFLLAINEALEGTRHHAFHQLKLGHISPNLARRQRDRDDRIREVADQLVEFVRSADCECPSDRCPNLKYPCPRCQLLLRATGENPHG